MVRYGSARTLIHHKAQRGMAWLGEARLGRDLIQHMARLAAAGHGLVGLGMAGHGKAGILKHNTKPPQHSTRSAGG